LCNGETVDYQQGIKQPIRSIGLTAAVHKPRALESVCRLTDELTARGVPFVVNETVGQLCDRQFTQAPLSECARQDLVIVLGGDGGILAAAREAAPLGTPILGVDLGSFGFLAAEDPDYLMGDLDNLLAGRFGIENHVMLRVGVGDADTWALNDAVISKNLHGRMIRLRTLVDGDHIATFPADGLIVATATGSTAYNLSAGGPIVDSRMGAMVLTPICPHTLYSRPLILPAEVEVTLTVEADGKEAEGALLLIDGQESSFLTPGQPVSIRRAPRDAQLVRLGKFRFYDRLREKLRWGAER